MRRYWFVVLAIGLVLLTVGVSVMLGREWAFRGLTLLLVGIAAVYLGFAIAQGELRAIAVQVVGFGGFFGLCMIALQGAHWSWLLALGYFFARLVGLAASPLSPPNPRRFLVPTLLHHLRLAHRPLYSHQMVKLPAGNPL